MSSSIPPGGPQGPEYLDQGGGSPLPTERRPGVDRTKLLIGGGAVAALALVGGGVWAAMAFFGQGPQPAEALPSSTLGYAAVDLDPSGEQKVEAIQMLRKFPAFEKEVGLDTDDDLRQKVFEESGLGEACPDLTYADDVEPWLGNRFAVAAIDLGEDKPAPVVVLQVKDATRAEEGVTALVDCAASADDEYGGWVAEGEWMVVAETESIAQDVVDATAEGSLADDAEYQQWTEEAGDAGVLNLYAAPEAGKYLADSFDSLFGLGMMGAYQEDFSVESSEDGATLNDMSETEMPEPEVPEELRQMLEDFGGAAATLRFDDGALEFEVAGDSALTQQGFPVSDGGDDVLATLPEGTAVAFGLGFTEGWFSEWLDRMSSFGGMDADELIAQAEAETGLELPEDVETLFGESAALSISPDIDAEALVNSSSPEGLPLGVKVKGDPEAIEEVLEKLRTALGPDGEFLLSQTGEDDTIAVSPDEEYLAELAENGSLGDSDTFQNVVREAEDAGSILFVDFDAGEDWLVGLAGDDQEAADNLEPLEGLGVSGWVDDDAGHMVLRLTTD